MSIDFIPPQNPIAEAHVNGWLGSKVCARVFFFRKRSKENENEN